MANVKQYNEENIFRVFISERKHAIEIPSAINNQYKRTQNFDSRRANLKFYFEDEYPQTVVEMALMEWAFPSLDITMALGAE